MLTKPQHLFDEATRVTAGDSRWQGRTSPDYFAFVGPFGGFTAATILRALMEHPQRSGDPLAITVNYCAPIAEGEFDLDVRLVKANRSSQHWCVELSQGGGDVATLATAVFAERRPSWSHQQAQMPDAKPFDKTMPYAKIAAPWVKQYDFRFVEGDPDLGAGKCGRPAPIRSYGSPTACPARSTCCRWFRCRTRSLPASSMRGAAGAVRDGDADDLVPDQRRRSRRRRHHPRARLRRCANLQPQLSRPDRRVVVAIRQADRDHDPDGYFKA